MPNVTKQQMPLRAKTERDTMSTDLHLYCKATNECVETLRSGSTTTQQLDANVLACFLAYHASLTIRGSNEFMLRESDADDLDDSILWTPENYRDLLARAPEVMRGQEGFEQANNGGVWVRRTIDGRVI